MNDKLKRMAMNDNGFIFDPQTGVSYTTNATGLLILQDLKEFKSIEQIKKRIAAEFNVKPEEAERDIIDFLELLKSKGIVT